MSKLILDEELKNSSTDKLIYFYNIIYFIGVISLWIIAFIWLNLSDEILSINVEIVDEWAKNIFISTVIGFIVTGLGFVKKIIVNKWILVIGTLSLIVNSYLFFGQVMIYYNFHH